MIGTNIVGRCICRFVYHYYLSLISCMIGTNTVGRFVYHHYLSLISCMIGTNIVGRCICRFVYQIHLPTILVPIIHDIKLK
jgi:hypothetical protein